MASLWDPFHSDGGRDPYSAGLLKIIDVVPDVIQDRYLTTPITDRPHPVGIVDTGVVTVDGKVHPLLEGRIDYDETNIEIPAEDRTKFGHGTFVAGIIAQRAPLARMVMKGVLDTAAGKDEDARIAAAITQLSREHHCTLINLSFAGSLVEDSEPPEIKKALLGLPPETVVVAAAGNTSSHRRVYPAGINLGPGKALVIAVGAVDTTVAPHQIADFSTYGTWVSAYAPGVDVPGPTVVEKAAWGTWSGSSMAAAWVTGMIAKDMDMPDAGSARDCAQHLLDNVAKIGVWDVNGPHQRPCFG
jgi:subtilisin family serine protease